MPAFTSKIQTMERTLCTLVVLLGLLRVYQCMEVEQDYVVSNDELIAMGGESETLIDFNHLDVVGRERFINGSLKILADMDDDNFGFTVKMYTSPTGNGNYKKMATDVPLTKVCEGFKKFYKEFVQPSLKLGETSNMPYIGDDGLCPIPAGEYYFKNIEFNTESWPNQMPRGTLKIVVTFYKADKKIGDLTALLKIEDGTR